MKANLTEKTAALMMLVGIIWAVLLGVFFPSQAPYTPLTTGLFIAPIALAIAGAINFSIHLGRFTDES